MPNWLRADQQGRPDLSVLIVSFNTCDVLDECLRSLDRASRSLSVEVIVIDNGSSDGSVDMVRASWPEVHLLTSEVNLGFGVANNKAFEVARGRYIVLLNSDAFLAEDALRISIEKMDADPQVGLASGRLVGRDGALQPSARTFPSLATHVFVMTGLSNRFPKSRIFGSPDRTWADPMHQAEVDWVPGAYSIIRGDLLQRIGLFDPRFFLYYEEVDLCYRIKQAGYKVMYWPVIEVVHIGGESSRRVKSLELSDTGAQLVLWRMRSTLLFYRKHKGVFSTWLVKGFEVTWFQLRAWRNGLRSSSEAQVQAGNFLRMKQTMLLAWTDTQGGRVSPPHPW